MQDREGRNALCGRMRDLMCTALSAVSDEPCCRVVVLEGLPDCFSIGASERMLLGSREFSLKVGQDMISAVTDCPIPVIAAVQGHAIGGGLLLALAADLAVYSERSRYGANFVHYGFSPVNGARALLANRLNPALAAEMLYTGALYSGRDLAELGAAIPVVEHTGVPQRAHELASSIAHAPRHVLELLKGRLSEPTRRAVRAAAEGDYADHLATYDQAAVRARHELLRAARRPRTAR
jgi:polyketide biosynthesis enoyl-CoA hydratase PksI